MGTGKCDENNGDWLDNLDKVGPLFQLRDHARVGADFMKIDFISWI